MMLPMNYVQSSMVLHLFLRIPQLVLNGLHLQMEYVGLRLLIHNCYLDRYLHGNGRMNSSHRMLLSMLLFLLMILSFFVQLYLHSILLHIQSFSHSMVFGHIPICYCMMDIVLLLLCMVDILLVRIPIHIRILQWYIAYLLHILVHILDLHSLIHLVVRMLFDLHCLFLFSIYMLLVPKFRKYNMIHMILGSILVIRNFFHLHLSNPMILVYLLLFVLALLLHFLF
mmetsp:Transcript_110686/g.263955  ORF Transcript_110686/g.263955 Transcript_110686/m.263955 type:complete len:226 (-) Transcript_110686:711-1388(-)